MEIDKLITSIIGLVVLVFVIGILYHYTDDIRRSYETVKNINHQTLNKSELNKMWDVRNLPNKTMTEEEIDSVGSYLKNCSNIDGSIICEI